MTLSCLRNERICIFNLHIENCFFTQSMALFTIFMSLGFPLIMFIPGYLIGKAISESQGVQLLTSLAGVAVGFIISAVFFRLNKKKYTPVIVEKKE